MPKNPDTRRTTLDLDADAEERLERLVGNLRRATGALPSHRGRRPPSRADLLRAVLIVLDGDRSAMADVRNQVLREVLAPVAGAELESLAADLRRGVVWMSTPDTQDAVAEVAAELERLASSNALDDVDDDGRVVADELHRHALRVARLAATAGGYEGLRPMLDIARRIELVRDAVDPATMHVCLHCNQEVRLKIEGRLEQHITQAGDMCPGGQPRADG